MKFTRENARAFGSKGGSRTFAKHGTEHMRRIGKIGFKATTDRHFGGDKRKHLNYLVSKGLACMDPCPWNGIHQDYQAFPDKPSEDNQ